MTSQDIFSKLCSTQKLPTPSRVALEVMRLCYSDDASLEDVAKIIKTDPSLSSELIKYANSAFMFTGIQVASIEKATVKLGMKMVVNLALGFSLLSHNKEDRCSEFNYGYFWSRSLARGIAARALARLDKKINPDELFICGLLGQMGRLALAAVFPSEYSAILARKLPIKLLLAQETNKFGINHAELTTELFNDWGLPEKYGVAVTNHELFIVNQSNIPIPHHLPHLLYLADQIAGLCQLTVPQPQKLLQLEKQAEDYGLATEFATLFDNIISGWQDWGNSFKIPTKQCPLYHEIKARESDKNNTPSDGDNGMRILIADDDPLTILNLKKMLTRTGAQIYEAEDGDQALQLALEILPNIIITDWKMPGLNGLELCKLLRQTDSTRHIYIIILTTCEDDDDIVQAFDAGADDYVVKPFTPKVLEARIRGGERLIRYQNLLNKDREVIQEYAAKLSTANQKLQNMAMTDPLTKLPNRRFALSRMKESVTKARRHQESLCCIMIDVDLFKDINDSYGHHVGDLVLKELAYIFKKAARNYDTICRMGGEEFLVISYRNNLKNTLLFAERIRLAVENHRIVIGTKTITLTISLGAAQWDPETKDDDEVIRQADRALYSAKANGRNRVEQPPKPF